MKATTQQDWQARVDRAIDLLRRSLDRPVLLDELAQAACFSPFHFHRIFKQVTGETVRETTARLRVERAARLLGTTRSTVTEIALECGYAGSAELSRAFRAHFGTSPSTHRRAPKSAATEGAFAEAARRARAEEATHPVEVRTVAPTPIAYVRVLDPYRGSSLLDGYAALTAFIAENAQIGFGPMIGAQIDDPDITPPELCRHDLCVTIPAEGVRGEGRLRTAVLAGGSYACLELKGSLEDTVRAWDFLFARWLPDSGWEPRDEPALEIWLAPPDPAGYHLELRLPVKRS